MDCAETPEHHEFHGQPKPPAPIPDGKPNPFYARHAAKLAQLREECVVSKHGARDMQLEKEEWKQLPFLFRYFVLTSSGFANAEQAVERDWREHNDAERIAIRATLREWLRHLRALGVLIL